MDDIEIGNRIRKRREELKLTQLELATKLNLRDNQISRWENGKRSVHASDFPLLAKALYTTVGYFLEDNPDDAHDENEPVYEPILDALKVAASRNLLTDNAVEDIERYARFRADEEARRRGGEQ